MDKMDAMHAVDYCIREPTAVCAEYLQYHIIEAICVRAAPSRQSTVECRVVLRAVATCELRALSIELKSL